uniref:CnbE n=1 Tax=Comamonas testosteroni CNB-1 TaxID=543891 RepID=Q38M38_COMTE|nr:CnbE [Comamonas testosteroni CNB-1]
MNRTQAKVVEGKFPTQNTMDNSKIQHYGDELYQSLLDRQPVAPLTDREADITIEDAYQIQLRMIQRRLDAGERVVGKKIGVTSKVVMDMLKVNQPDFGHLLSGMVYNEGQPIPVSSMIAPKAEAEVAFILARDLEGPGVTAADVLRATDCVMPCFEIVDSRIKDWKIKIQDTVADNASCGVLTLGGLRKSPRDLDLALAGMVLEKNGEIISTSCGASVQGSPVNAVAWLANTLGRLGIGLKAGDIILSGSQSPLVPVVAGDSLYCSVGGLGGTSVRFVA